MIKGSVNARQNFSFQETVVNKSVEMDSTLWHINAMMEIYKMEMGVLLFAQFKLISDATMEAA